MEGEKRQYCVLIAAEYCLDPVDTLVCHFDNHLDTHKATQHTKEEG